MRVRKFFKFTIAYMFASAILVLGLWLFSIEVYNLPQDCCIAYSDLQGIQEQDRFGKFISATFNEDINVGATNSKETEIWFKLFGIFPIRKLKIKICPDKSVYLGGNQIGFQINSKGVIIISENSVMTENGLKNTEKSAEIKNGDIILSVNNQNIDDASDILALLEKAEGNVSLKILRGTTIFDCNVVPLEDLQSKCNRLGLWVKNDATGIGTLTYVECDTMRYGALGHSIIDFETGVSVPVEDGEIYKCSLLGINKGKRGEPGELRCLFMQGKNVKGNIEKNGANGVFGVITDSDIVNFAKECKVSGRINVKSGKAKILSAVSGILEEYDIEIIKTNYQTHNDDKGIILRVTDERLLNLTGGIVQGMSGSPILQDDKLVGAVTHVFVSDPTKGYGIYSDWMLQE